MKKHKSLVVLVTGNRKWKDRRKVFKELHKRRKRLAYVIEGGAQGADRFAYECAKLLGAQPVTCDANWDKFHRSAGPIRNQKMLDLLLQFRRMSKLVLAFHRNLKKSRGTADMVRRARKAKVAVKVIK